MLSRSRKGSNGGGIRKNPSAILSDASKPDNTATADLPAVVIDTPNSNEQLTFKSKGGRMDSSSKIGIVDEASTTSHENESTSIRDKRAVINRTSNESLIHVINHSKANAN